MHIRSTPGLLLRVRSNIGAIRSTSGLKVIYSYSTPDETILETTSEEATITY